ncbi:unnamed protein product [Ranitomeya imitator]|uniref:DUF4704 domain-containing protein n=1 Tax=Ranitomeya imitator TaxID=111125 RepID=A0ABN9KXZ7_9NEOB|nr:unnamed protein product [Ranitomeya imitator]
MQPAGKERVNQTPENSAHMTENRSRQIQILILFGRNLKWKSFFQQHDLEQCKQQGLSEDDVESYQALVGLLCENEPSRGHIQYLSTIIKDSRKHFRKKYGVQFLLDTIRIYYSKENSLSSEDLTTIRMSLFGLIKYFLSKGDTQEEIQSVIGYIAATSDEEQLCGILKILEQMLNCNKVYEKSKQRIRLREVGYSGLGLLVNDAPVSTLLIKGLLNQVLRADPVINYRDLLAVVHMSYKLDLTVRVAICRKVLQILQFHPDAASQIAHQVGWQDTFVRFFMKENSEFRSSAKMNCQHIIKEEDKNSRVEESQRSHLENVALDKSNISDNGTYNSWCPEEARSLNTSIQSTSTLLDESGPSFSEAQLHVEDPEVWPSDHSHLTLELANIELGDGENQTPESSPSTPSPVESSKSFNVDRLEKDSSSTNILFRDDLSLSVNLESKESPISAKTKQSGTERHIYHENQGAFRQYEILSAPAFDLVASTEQQGAGCQSALCRRSRPFNRVAQKRKSCTVDVEQLNCLQKWSMTVLNGRQEEHK